METIIFYNGDTELGRSDLPLFTDYKDRMKIAKTLGIERYGRIKFVRENGDVRVDSDNYKNKSIFDKELNKKIK